MAPWRETGPYTIPNLNLRTPLQWALKDLEWNPKFSAIYGYKYIWNRNQSNLVLQLYLPCCLYWLFSDKKRPKCFCSTASLISNFLEAQSFFQIRPNSSSSFSRHSKPGQHSVWEPNSTNISKKIWAKSFSLSSIKKQTNFLFLSLSPTQCPSLPGKRDEDLVILRMLEIEKK